MATNLGLTRMAEACGISYDVLRLDPGMVCAGGDAARGEHRPSSTTTTRLQLTKVFGGGTMSSSDGQRFPVRGKSLTGREMVIHGGRVLSTYTHVSDQQSTYGTKIIVPTAREAHYVAGRIPRQRDRPADLPSTRPTPTASPWSTSGCSTWSASALSPRIRDLGKITLVRDDPRPRQQARYPHAGPLLTARWNEDLVAGLWTTCCAWPGR